MGELQTLLALVVLIYVLCVIVQAVQEVVKSILDTKATTMEQVIKTALGDHVSVDQLTAALAKRGLNLTNLEQFNKDDFLKLLDGIQLAVPQIMPQVAAAAATAAGTVDQLKDHIATAYEAARTKFQQAYARKNKAWVIAISFVVVLALNASLIKIYDILSVDQQMSQAIAGTASNAAGQSNANGGPSSQTPDLAAIYARNRTAIEGDLKQYPVLLRTGQYSHDFQEAPLQELGGLLLMGALVSLGAPFWNDLLKGVTGFNNALNSGVKKTP